MILTDSDCFSKLFGCDINSVLILEIIDLYLLPFCSENDETNKSVW